jgi:hypothetical protein
VHKEDEERDREIAGKVIRIGEGGRDAVFEDRKSGQGTNIVILEHATCGNKTSGQNEGQDQASLMGGVLDGMKETVGRKDIEYLH